MAFIKEGLGDFTLALYYLDFYFKVTSDNKVLSKMEELAGKHSLEGYKRSDTDYFVSLVARYRFYLMASLAALALLIGAMIYRRKKTHEKPVGWGIALVVVLLFMFTLVNFQLAPTKGILVANQVFLMSGPSAGSELIEVVSKGHQVTILREGDVWTKVEWKDQPVYVRAGKLKRTI
jgi:hypothetical protein